MANLYGQVTSDLWSHEHLESDRMSVMLPYTTNHLVTALHVYCIIKVKLTCVPKNSVWYVWVKGPVFS